jgi:hypothetical protein
VPKKAKGHHTKPNVWDEAGALEVWRGAEKLDPGVNYFVLLLDQLGLNTYFSCEGHPDGFYVTFGATYDEAFEIKKAGFFSVEIEGNEYWSMRRTGRPAEFGDPERVDALRWAAEAWEEKLEPLDFDRVELER